MLIGCANNLEAFPTEIPNNPSPTIVDTNPDTTTPHATLTPFPTVGLPNPRTKLTNIRYVMIYSDEFNPDWELAKTTDVNTNIGATTLFNEGTQSIAISPKIGLSRTSIVVREDALKKYPRDIILGFRFWINPANGYIKPSNLMINVIGSNAYSYYVEGDDSVKKSNDPEFSETPLDLLGNDQVMSPETWVEVVVLLDDLVYVPDFEYIVGFYIKYAEGFIQTLYIDDIQLIIKEGEFIPQIPTSTSTVTITPSATSTSTQPLTPYWTPTPTRTKKPSRRESTEEPLPTIAP
jgi:hypothetical protein